MTPDAPSRWTLLVPVKQTAVAKSRLADFAGPMRAELAQAMALDCVTSALECRVVRRVVVVTDDPFAAEFRRIGAVVYPDLPDNGLNPALTYAADRVRLEFAEQSVASLSADLAALRSDELLRALGQCRDARGFVSDVAGTGTTMLAADTGYVLDPRFGPDSATAHQVSGAMPIDISGIDSVRRDVDTADDLTAAIELGVGPATAKVIARLELLRGTRIA
jgi:2-phospho-L-lactate/phosphoenolpyruvate guanylyltransferase